MHGDGQNRKQLVIRGFRVNVAVLGIGGWAMEDGVGVGVRSMVRVYGCMGGGRMKACQVYESGRMSSRWCWR